MDIMIEYNTGQTFQINVPEDALENTIACVLDDVSTKMKKGK